MVEFKHIQVTLGNRNILRDISVSVFKELNYIIGLNGSGKTTLIKSLLKLVPFSGEVKIAGQNITDLNASQLARKVAVVHQQLTLPFKVKVFDFVLMGRFPYLNWLGNYLSSDIDIANTQLERLNISNLKDRFLNEISGGELQKVYIARALAQQADILVLDEPAQSLDPLNKEALYQLLEALVAQGKLVLCITHDVDPLKNSNARVIGIHNGKIVWDERGGADQKKLMNVVYKGKSDQVQA